MPEPRRVARSGMPVDVQLGLIHGDIDSIHNKLDEMGKRAEDREEEIDKTTSRILWALVTTSITMGTTMVLFVLNLITGSFS